MWTFPSAWHKIKKFHSCKIQVLVFTATHEQQFPLPRYGGNSKCYSLASSVNSRTNGRRSFGLQKTSALFATEYESVGAGQRHKAPPVAVSDMASCQAQSYANSLLTRIQCVVRLHVMQS